MNQVLHVSEIGDALPAYVKKLPINLQMGWKSAYLTAADLYGFDRAIKVANAWLLKKMDDLENQPDEEDDGSEEIKERLMDKIVSTELEAEESELVSFSENGDIVLNAVLATDLPSKRDGLAYTESSLIDLADQINKRGMTLPDIEHSVYDKVMEETATLEEFKAKLKNEKGLLTKVKAFVQNGKLLIRAWLDKRYKNHVNKYKSLSLEAHVPMENRVNGKIQKAEVLGFTFTNTPNIPGADIVNVE